MINQVLFHSLSMVNQEISKDYKDFEKVDAGIDVGCGGRFASAGFPGCSSLLVLLLLFWFYIK